VGRPSDFALAHRHPGWKPFDRRRAMPEYEFECQQCGEKFSQKETYEEHDQHKEKCPKCGSKRVEQLVSQVHVKTSKKS
jgi:putative FmdB family regulatory protein